MRRGGPIKRRSPLRTRSRIQRKTPIKRGQPRHGKKSAYASRERDTRYMVWVKSLECCAATDLGLGGCSRVVEADHAGRRPLGRKCPDTETIPLCSQHHRERTDFAGAFKSWDRARMREWLDRMIAETQARCPWPVSG